jgi:hypothetical protein
MNYNELDQQTVDRAVQECLKNPKGPSLALMIAKLAREQGPVFITEPKPVAVDPDLAEAQTIYRNSLASNPMGMALAAIKRGRALAAEAKPGMVWVKHDGSEQCPVDQAAWVWFKEPDFTCVMNAKYINWRTVTHYAIISQPEEK